jgi:hypothetical protein
VFLVDRRTPETSPQDTCRSSSGHPTQTLRDLRDMPKTTLRCDLCNAENQIDLEPD